MSKNALRDITEGRFLKKSVLLVHTFRKVKQAREAKDEFLLPPLSGETQKQLGKVFSIIMDQKNNKKKLWASHDLEGVGNGGVVSLCE